EEGETRPRSRREESSEASASTTAGEQVDQPIRLRRSVQRKRASSIRSSPAVFRNVIDAAPIARQVSVLRGTLGPPTSREAGAVGGYHDPHVPFRDRSELHRPGVSRAPASDIALATPRRRSVDKQRAYPGVAEQVPISCGERTDA